MSSTIGQGDVLCRYYTPAPLALAAVRRLLADGFLEPGQSCVDPHAGGGAWVRAIQALAPDCPVVGCDIYPPPGSDWYAEDFLHSDRTADWLIGNPPFTGAERHIEKGLALSGIGLVFLLRLGFLSSRSRQAFWLANRPAAVYVLVERPSFTGQGSDSADYCIVVWRHDHRGPTRLEWLSWK